MPTLTLAPGPGADEPVEVSRWPFARGEIELVVEARRLPATFTSQAAMRAALARAPWVSPRTALRPGGQE